MPRPLDEYSLWDRTCLSSLALNLVPDFGKLRIRKEGVPLVTPVIVVVEGDVRGGQLVRSTRS